MQAIKFGKFAALVVAFGVIVGCSSKGGDTGGTGAVDPNAGYTTPVSTGDSMSSEEAALRAVTTFYFELDSAELKPEAMRALDVHAKDLRAAGNRVVLEGHTDERGSREYNMALGNRRAEAVRQFLSGFGLAENRFEIVSFGEGRPLQQGSTESDWARNRRGQFVITAGADAINPAN